MESRIETSASGEASATQQSSTSIATQQLSAAIATQQSSTAIATQQLSTAIATQSFSPASLLTPENGITWFTRLPQRPQTTAGLEWPYGECLEWLSGESLEQPSDKMPSIASRLGVADAPIGSVALKNTAVYKMLLPYEKYIEQLDNASQELVIRYQEEKLVDRMRMHAKRHTDTIADKKHDGNIADKWVYSGLVGKWSVEDVQAWLTDHEVYPCFNELLPLFREKQVDGPFLLRLNSKEAIRQLGVDSSVLAIKAVKGIEKLPHTWPDCWSVEQLIPWLKIRCIKYLDKKEKERIEGIFKDNQIDGPAFLSLTKEKLEKLGITNETTRDLMVAEINGMLSKLEERNKTQVMEWLVLAKQKFETEAEQVQQRRTMIGK